MMRLLAIVFMLAPSVVSAQTSLQASLPSAATIETSLRRTFGYDPAVTWTVLWVRPSLMPGVAEMAVSINKGEGVHIFMSPDGKTAIVGSVIPFGVDPFAPARAVLRDVSGPSRGARDAKIDMVVFSEFQCPHCKTAQPVLDRLSVDFPQVRQIFQQFPLSATIHPWATKAALYGDCLGRVNGAAAWKYMASVFDAQEKITPSNVDSTLTTLAVSAGTPADKLTACVNAPDTRARVDASLKVGQSIVLDVNQLPTVFINGRKVLSIATIPYDQLKLLVQFEIDHAGK